MSPTLAAPSRAAFRMRRNEFEPAYLRAWHSGALRRKTEEALAALEDCTLWPRDCHLNRPQNKYAVCKTGRHAVVGSHFPHFGEEHCLRGRHGSGTIFFSWCNLSCVFSQIYDISWEGASTGRKALRSHPNPNP